MPPHPHSPALIQWQVPIESEADHTCPSASTTPHPTSPPKPPREPSVCTTELGAVAHLESQFALRGAKVIGLSVDPVENHSKWAQDIEDVGGAKVNYPMIGDPELQIAKLYDMLPADAGETSEGRTPANNAPVRTVFVIGPDKKIKLHLAYPMTTGRNFDEVLRVLDSMQLTARHKVATPADWKQGDDVIITAAVSNEEADKLFPGYKTLKPYLRTTSQPKDAAQS